jgi:hypothetical protein
MDIKASAGRSKKSFFNHCESLTLKATREGEAQFLAAIVSVISVRGGRILIEDCAGETVLDHRYVKESPAPPLASEAAAPATTTGTASPVQDA